MKKYMRAATSTQGRGSISLSLTTPTHCGGQKQFTTESIILDKNLTHHVRGEGCADDGVLFGTSLKHTGLFDSVTLSGVSVRCVRVCVTLLDMGVGLSFVAQC